MTIENTSASLYGSKSARLPEEKSSRSSEAGKRRQPAKRALRYTITEEDNAEARQICQLKSILKYDNLEAGEVNSIIDMISKKKTEPVLKTYRTAHPRAKEDPFYQLADGRWK